MKGIKRARILSSICILNTIWQRPASLLQYFDHNYLYPIPHIEQTHLYDRQLGFGACSDASAMAGQCWELETKTLTAEGDPAEQRCISFCFAASWAQWARAQEALAPFRQLMEESLKPRGGSGPQDPAHLPAKPVSFDHTWDIRKISLTAGLRMHMADVCCHQHPFTVDLKRTPHTLNCFL